MKRLLFASAAAIALLSTAGCSTSSSADERPWMNTSLSPDQRADLVIKEMTLDEKIAMVNGTMGMALRKENPDEKRIGAGHVPGVQRLGIPDLYETDASLGVSNGGEMRKGDVATALPGSLMTASTFDPAIAEEGGKMIGSEARAKGFNVQLAGGANLVRDPWNGRDFEYLSEDVLLTAEMAAASINGIQSNGIVSTIKHYVLNAQESGRNVLDAKLGEAALRESDLLAFQLAIEKSHPGSVMCGYNQVNGHYACESDFLLNEVLKQDWGYTGWVMSDWGAVHSTVKAANAGLDQESGQELDKEVYFGAPLKKAVEDGAVPMARLDNMVHRIIRTMFEHGLVDHPAPEKPEKIDYDAHAKVAQKTAEAGMVLLKNDNDLLPLASSAKKIVLIGSHADVGVLSGGGSSQVRSVGGDALQLPMPDGGPLSGFIKITYHASSPLQAIKARAGAGAEVSYVDGTDIEAAAKAAKDADIAIVFGSEWRTEAQDVENLNLPGDQDKLIEAVSAANDKTVVVLETGGPVVMPWQNNVGAILEAWYPGQKGGEAIAAVLFGDVNPSGHLPVTFPAALSQAPRPQIPGIDLVHKAKEDAKNKPANTDLSTVDLTGGVPPFPVEYREGADVGYRWYQKKGFTPLYPFGYGLSYTSFAYSDLKITDGENPSISFKVTNTGKRAGADVPQVYAAPDNEMRRLVGFQRVMLEPGESKVVTVSIEPRLIADYDTGKRGWVIKQGGLPITVGHHAGDASLTGVAEVSARTLKP
ncbi:glycosyl hydrolase [Altererythrobacter indicus]|uniref:Glycosyl hydrolase n=1 Tax=Altericroceibacterium indicum TaxID=374177 RepID=A0A845A5Z1_9SPHN|nr:beta-glucosidase [Altericroceibacterium indicum]MXP24451.1 glycosyl hydrolase [Altericroceibacterium indicum]